MKKVFCIICGGNLTENGEVYECDSCKKSFLKCSVDSLYAAALVGSITGEESIESLSKDALKRLLEGGAEGVSISLIQRMFGYGFPKAARIFDWLVKEGLVDGATIGKMKSIKITLDEFSQKYGV